MKAIAFSFVADAVIKKLKLPEEMPFFPKERMRIPLAVHLYFTVYIVAEQVPGPRITHIQDT